MDYNEDCLSATTAAIILTSSTLRYYEAVKTGSQGWLSRASCSIDKGRNGTERQQKDDRLQYEQLHNNIVWFRNIFKNRENILTVHLATYLYCSLGHVLILVSLVLLLYAFSDLRLLVGHHEEHPTCKNTVMRRYHGYLSGARYKWFAYGPGDATATPSSLASLKSRLVQPFWCQLTHVILEKKPLNGCLSVLVLVLAALHV